MEASMPDIFSYQIHIFSTIPQPQRVFGASQMTFDQLSLFIPILGRSHCFTKSHSLMLSSLFSFVSLIFWHLLQFLVACFFQDLMFW